MSISNYLKYSKHLFIKEKVMPIYFVFFITDRCTANCRHCLRGGFLSSKEELCFDEIEKISLGMEDLLFFLPTGGEPFIRDDYAEIVNLFFKNNKANNVGSATNGSLTDKIVDTVIRVLETCEGIDYAVDISIDDIGERHDYIRREKKLFEKAVYTYKELEKVKKIYPKFNLNIGITISSYNQNNIDEIYKFLISDLKVKNINQLLVRGEAMEPNSKDVDINKYADFSRKLENAKDDLTGYKGYIFADFINAMRIFRRRILEKTVRENKWQLPCLAANLGGVMLSNGDVYPCELLEKKIGNIRDVDFNFRELWFNEKASEIRKFIKDTKCFCTYECFLTLNTFFSLKTFPKVFNEWLRIKYKRYL